MPHIIKNSNPLEGHRPDKSNPGEWETLSPEGTWEPATESHSITLINLVPSGTGGGTGGGGAADGDFTFLLQAVDPNRPVIRNAPNGDLIQVDPKNPAAFTVIAKAQNGVPPLIRLDGNGNLISIPDPVGFPKKFHIIVPSSKAPVPTAADVKKVATVALPGGKFVTAITAGGAIKFFVSDGPPQDTEAPIITGTSEFADGVTRVHFSDGAFRDVPPGQPLPIGHDSVSEAEAAGRAKGIPDPDIWIDPNTGLFRFDIPSDSTPSGTKIVSQNVVGDETIYKLENGQIIRQKTNPTEAPSSFFTDIDPATGQLLRIDRTTGDVTPISGAPEGDPVERPEEVTIGGQTFAFNPNTGQFQQVQTPSREFDPDVVTIDGRAFIQGPNGQLTPLGREEVPNLDELITERLLSKDAPGALALADFRDRPTSLEAFTAAMQFAQSPGDVAAISAISRGQSLVAPPPSGTVQRIAEQPEFLQDAFQRLIGQFRGGSGSPGEFMDVLTRINRERDQAQSARKDSEKRLAENEQEALQQQIARLQKDIKEQASNTGTTGGDLGSGFSGSSSMTLAAFDTLTPQEKVQFITAGGTLTTQANSPLTPESIARTHARNAGHPTGQPSNRTDDPRQSTPEQQSMIDQLLGRTESAATSLDTALALSRSTTGINQRNRIAPNAAQTPPIAAPPPRDLGPTRFITQTQADERKALEFSLSDDEGQQNFNFRLPSNFQIISDEQAGLEAIDSFAGGGTTHHAEHMEIVGEDGPELVQLPPGTKVTANKDITPAQLRALKKVGVRGMQEGGIVDPLLPFGVRRALSGGIIEPTRRRLSRAAGLPVLSAQARQNLLPEELEVFNRLSRESGIPEGAFRQEQESAFPGANLARGRARFAPRVLR